HLSDLRTRTACRSCAPHTGLPGRPRARSPHQACHVKLALTLLAKNEAHVIDANVAYHLSAGVALFVATDNASTDGTTEILERYAQDGVLELIREPSADFKQGEWVTRMARRAAERGADRVGDAHAGARWWSRGGEPTGA